MPAEKFSRYEMREELGVGGVATVYRAFDPMFERQVALKILRRDLLKDPQVRERFERETKIIAKLEHAAIVPVHDVGYDNGQLFYVMRYMAGGSLSERIESGLTPNEIANILLRVAAALDYAHGKGVVHRDLKPGNILFDENNNPYISDFGIAKFALASTRITSSGIIGTPRYMSPEQARGDESDGRSDVYSLGVVLFEMLSGRTPFEATTPLAMAFKHAVEAPPSILKINPNLPDGIDAVIAKVLAKEPDDRYSTGAEFANAFLEMFPEAASPEGNFITPLPPRARPSAETPTELLPSPALRPRSSLRVWMMAEFIILTLIAFAIWRYPLLVISINYIGASITKALPYFGIGIVILLGLVTINYTLQFAQISIKKSQELRRVNQDKKSIAKSSPSALMKFNVLAEIDPHKRQEILALIGRDHELRLKDKIKHFGGGRYLLHGYGRFGATALIDQIAKLAKYELASQSQAENGGIVMTVRIDASTFRETDNGVDAVIQEFQFEAKRGNYSKAFTTKLNKLHQKEVEEIENSSKEHTMVIKVAPIPGVSAEFARKTGQTLVPGKRIINRNDLMQTIANFLDRAENHKPLMFETFAYKFMYANEAPTRLIIVIDKIKSETVFNTMRSMNLFNDKRISFFAIVDHEDYLTWSENPEVKIMISDLGFEPHYLRCLWEEETGFVEELMVKGFDIKNKNDREKDFKDHIAFVARGSPGDALREVRKPEYCEFNDGRISLNLSAIIDWEKLERNAQIQRILCKNWKKILSPYFNGVGSDEKDRPKRSVYEVIDWINKRVAFTLPQVEEFASKAPIRISDTELILKSVLKALITVLVEENFLIFKGESFGIAYRMRQEDL